MAFFLKYKLFLKVDDVLKNACMPHIQLYLYIGQVSNLCRITVYYLSSEIIVISCKNALEVALRGCAPYVSAVITLSVITLVAIVDYIISYLLAYERLFMKHSE